MTSGNPESYRTDPTITRDKVRETMIAPLLVATPSFILIWENFLAEWADHPSELPIYLLLADLARHIATLVKQEEENELRRIFEVVETWHVKGDHYVREAATVGLLEDLQNSGLVGEETTTKCVAYLGPVSLRNWHKVERFWLHGELITDD